MIKIIPHGTARRRICELVRYYMEDVTVKGAWTGPAALQLFAHATRASHACRCAR